MAINKVTYPSTPTPASGDWALIVDLMQTNYYLTEGPARIDWDTDDVLQGAVFQIGGVVYLADADTAISGTPSDYVKITPSDATAAAAYVTDLTGVTWNAVYNGYYDASGNLYVFSEIKAILAGEITAAETRIGKAYEDLLAGANTFTGDNTFGGVNITGSSLDFTGANSDRTINFASDASLKWDESDDIFRINKQITIKPYRYINDSATENGIFDNLKKFIPNNTDLIGVTGSLAHEYTYAASGYYGVDIFIVCDAYRAGSSEIILHGIAYHIEGGSSDNVWLDSTAATISCTDGDTSAPSISGGTLSSIFEKCAIAWG